MRLDRRSHRWLGLQGAAFSMLLLALLGVLAWLSQLYGVQADVSRSARQPLPEATAELLEQVEQPLTVIAFVRPDDVLDGHIRQMVERFRQAQPLMTLRVINPDVRPDLVREFGIEGQGELVIQYGDREERVSVPSEPRVATALQRLLRQAELPLLYLTGHGERNLTGDANHDLGAFGRYLSERGHRLEPLQPARVSAIPPDAEALVIAGPRSDWLPVVEQRIRDYVDEGGSLLWLVDERDEGRLDFLARLLGLQLLPGVVVEPRSEELLGVDNPRLLVVDDYAGHPALGSVEGVSLLAGARALDLGEAEDDEWTVEILLRSEERHWNETDDLDDPAFSTADGEQQGPLMLGLALRRPHPAGNGEQRVVVMGNAGFLSNAWIGNGANLPLGLALIDWLSDAGSAGLMAGQATPDQRLALGQTQVVVLGFGLLLGLPGGCLLIAALLWWRRRRA